MKNSRNPTFRFECQRCGDCCKSPGQMIDKDLERIALRLGITKRQLYDTRLALFQNLVGLKPKTEQDEYCTFFDREKQIPTCSIMDVAPATCRQQPVKVDPGRNIWLSNCPGLGKGKERDLAEWITQREIAETEDFMRALAGRVTHKLQFHPHLANAYMDFVRAGKVNPSRELYDFFEETIREAYGVDR